MIPLELLGNFPAQPVPDGIVAVPHHFTYLAIAAILATGTVWDDYRHKEPIIVVGALTGALIAFNLMWPHARYRPLGPSLAVVLPILALLAIVLPVGKWRFWPWEIDRPYPIGTSWVVSLLILGALDDVVEHAFGVWTPLDWFFGEFGIMASFLFGLVSIVGLAVVVWNWDHIYDIFNLGP